MERQCNFDSSLGYSQIEYRNLKNLSYELNKIERYSYGKITKDNEFKLELVLKRKVDNMKSIYNYITVDAGTKYDLLMENAMSSANKIIVTINADYYSREVLMLMLQDITYIQKKL